MLSARAKRRLRFALGSASTADEVEQALIAGGTTPHIWYVDATNGQDGNDGASWRSPFKTMAKAFTEVATNDTVVVVGTVTEQITAPLGVYGVKVVGGAGGNTRHDNGARWKEAAVAGNRALVTIREQGWEFHNILFVPETGYAAIRAHRAESATYPDSSHFIVNYCKFVGNTVPGTPLGRAIEDFGGNHHYVVQNCEFNDLEYGIYAGVAAGDPGIAAPLRNVIQNNIFEGNKNDVYFNGSRCVVRNNLFRTVYHATAHPNTVNLAATQDVATGNSVYDNFFADAAGDVTIAKGYKPSTGDMWCNHVAGTAAYIAAVPS